MRAKIRIHPAWIRAPIPWIVALWTCLMVSVAASSDWLRLEIVGPGTRLELDRADLLALKQRRLESLADVLQGPAVFEGPLLRDVLDLAGIRGGDLVASALNGYSVTIPYSDVEKMPVILALKRDGVDLTPRTFGPVWIVYPMDSKHFREAVHQPRMIWSVRSIRARASNP